MSESRGDPAHAGYHRIAEAERLIAAAERDPAAARAAARCALQGLLLYWNEQPQSDSVRDLLAQAARTDDSLSDFAPHAVPLDDDRQTDPGLLRDLAKVFLDAARGRIANI